ncbi:MAG TPA: extradiol ring-cleavage dioxygenase [Chloroflexota bacterium]|nr:extradiol ring-cleavage dioxygenase [Chloroflexota bacterium]
MAEILGIGCSHGPQMRLTDETMADVYFRHNLHNERTPAEWKDPSAWPAALRQEWGSDEGLEAARRHRAELLKGYRVARQAIDDFRPDVVVIFGDDQYENFREDVLPPFCIFAMDELELSMHSGSRGPAGSIVMERPPLQAMAKGSKHIGTFLADELVRQGVDVACSWKLHHHHGLAHAFHHTLDYLDWDRKGFPYTVVPFHVSCYGEDLRVPTPESEVVTGTLMEGVKVRPPVAPPPWRCYDVGKALGQVLTASQYRAIIIGSASWSHASLTDKHGYMWGDVDSDREHLEQLRRGEFHVWRDLDEDAIRRSGQHEMRNWICLAGAMEGRRAEVLAYAETYIFNSSKCVALFPVLSGNE